jgi:methionine-rich copper-binding protein CopC
MKSENTLLKIKPSLLLIVIFLTTVALCATGSWVVSAHDVQPTKSDPADGTALAKTPAKITVWFPEEVAAEKSTLKVFDAQGKQVDSGKGGVDLNDASHQVMVVNLPALPNGVYQVQWSIGLSDGDMSAGVFNFGVGNVIVPTSLPVSTEVVTPVTAMDPGAVNAQLPIGWLIAGGAIILVILAAVFLLDRRGV